MTKQKHKWPYVKFKEVLAYRKEDENDNYVKTIKLYNKIIAYISLADLLTEAAYSIEPIKEN